MEDSTMDTEEAGVTATDPTCEPESVDNNDDLNENIVENNDIDMDTNTNDNNGDNNDNEEDGEIEEEETVNEEVKDEGEKAKDEDLEEGECSSDEEPEPVKVEEVKEERKSEKDKKHHRRTRSRSRDRHKRSKRDKERKELSLSAEEKKKRDVLRKLKALEENMGIDWDEEEEEQEAEESDSGSSDSRSRSRSNTRSRSRSRSPDRRRRDREKRKREREDRHERRKKRRGDRDKRSKDDICHLYMQGKCQKSAKDCIFSHDAEPPQVWELCKFYLRDRCAKRDKCLYLHKGFPCKFFHTGRQCGETKESCKFSHEPLNDMTRTLLLKHIETAPKDILGEFPRMTRTEAANSIFQTEAKNKGWITEGPDAVQPPEVKEEEKMETGDESNKDSLLELAPSHIKLDPIQEKLLKASQQAAGLAGGRWNQGSSDQDAPPPLAVQQAMALGGRNAGYEGGVQSHGVRNNGAFSQTPVQTARRQTVGLLGAAPESPHWTGSPYGAGGFHNHNKPPGLMDIKVNEDAVDAYLIKQRIVAAKVHEEFNVPSEDEEGGNGGDETPEVTPPTSREGSPALDIQGLPVNLPKAQMKLLQRIQQKQRDRRDSDSQEENPNNDWHDEAGDNTEQQTDDKSVLGAPLTINSLNLPPGLTNVLTAIKNTSPGQGPSQEHSPVIKQDKRQDPRRNRNDPRRGPQPSASIKQETEEEIERKKDERIMDLDFDSFFGDLELPPLTVSPERTEEEKTFTNELGLPFKPHIIHEVAKEIDASFGSHSPIDWNLRPVLCPKPDYSDIKHLFSNAQLEADPRLRKFAKSGMAKLKELPLPSFPAPKSDPRLVKREAQVTKVPDRRRSSEDSEGGNVYNPAKELNKAKKQQQVHHQPQEVKMESEAYSPGQEYFNPSYNSDMDFKQEYVDMKEEKYSPEHQDGDGYNQGYHGEEYEDQMMGGHPPPNYPPYDHPQGYPPENWGPPDTRYQQHPHGRGFPPRGPPMDPYYQGGQPPPYGGPPRGGGGGHPYGPPRGKFNGPRNNGPRGGPRGNFNNGNDFMQNRGGGFNQQRKKDPRKR